MDYDICDPSIRCGADKVGASIFVIERSSRTFRVLAFNQRDAEILAREFAEQEPSANNGPLLFDF